MASVNPLRVLSFFFSFGNARPPQRLTVASLLSHLFFLAGLYINLHTYQSYGVASLSCDTVSTTTPTLYAWVCKYQIPRAPTPEEQEGQVAPTKMAIGVQGGFKTEEQKYQTTTVVHVVARLPDGTQAVFHYPSEALPSFVSSVVEGVVTHVASAVATTASTWVEEIRISRYAADLPVDDSIVTKSKLVVDISDPSKWVCEESGLTEGLWLNLSDGYIGSGKDLVCGW